MNPTEVLESLAAAAGSGPDSVDRVLQGLTVPVVGEDKALFIYRGPAQEVSLRLWISGVPSSQPLERLGATDVWTLETDLDPQARVEYKIEVAHGMDRQLIRDPLNPTTAPDPFGANSVVQGFSYSTPEWTVEHPDVPQGSVVEQSIWSGSFGEDRSIQVYTPALFRETRRYPLLVIHDGLDYLRFSNLQTVLDNLIHRLEIPPVVAALIQSPNRLVEYGANDAHAGFVVDDLVPELSKRYPLLDDPLERCLIGASFGAVASLHTAWRRPGVFGKLLLQSGSFAFTDIGDHDGGPLLDPVVDFMNAFRRDPQRVADKVFMSAGIYEPLIYFNRSLLPVIQRSGVQAQLVEAPDGHNWQNWRDRLRDGLTWLLPGPLWFVYQ